MKSFRRILCLCVPAFLAAALALAWGIRAPRVSASLYDLIGAEARRIPRFLQDASSSEMAILVSSPDAARARCVSHELAKVFSVASDMPPGVLAYVRENRGGLVTTEAAQLLRTSEGRAKIAKRAMRRLYASPIPPVLGYEDDPFGLTDAWLMSLAAERTGKTAEGCPVLVTNGVTRILLRHRLEPKIACDIDATIAYLGRLEQAAHRFSAEGVEVRFAGAPIHAAVSARRCKGEIGWLTGLSLAVIAMLAFLVFRSLRWLPLLACSLLVSSLAGGLALVTFFRDIHVMTLVMGTTVLGLVIDYSFHWLLSSNGERIFVRKNLLVSFLTTEIALVPLMLTTIPVLCQTAVFLSAGLAAALAYVIGAYPSGRSELFRTARFRCARSVRITILVLMVVCAVVALLGLARVSVRTDMTALYRPPPALLEAERQRAQFGEVDFSALPSLAERRENAAFVRVLYGEHAVKLMEALGVRSLPVPREPMESLVRPETLMNEILGEWTQASLRRLGFSILALLAVVVLFFRRRALRVLAPPILTLLLVSGALGWMNVPINLFHVLAAFLLLGMGIDYAVFLLSGGSSAMRPVVCSLLTSMAGFGALAFVSFPVVASFGIVLGIGLPTVFVLALLLRPVPSVSEHSGKDTGETHRVDSVEHGATLTGMETLFAFYRLFGLRVLHVMSAGVGLCVWLLSPAVRCASPSLKKVLFFTRSLADKFVVLAQGPHLPRVETDGSADAEAFVSDVRSGRGVFVLSSHVGTVEVLSALGSCSCTFHAWMDFDRTGVYNRFYLRHAKRSRVAIHPISGFGMGTVFEAGDWIDAGDCLVMAGDRGDGAFRFAAAFDHPVYFVACLAERGVRYRAVIRRLPSARKDMAKAYAEIRASLAAAYPDQLFDWERREMI